MIDEIDKIIKILDEQRIEKLEPIDISKTAKIPFKIVTIREIYLCRTVDFAISSRLLIDNKSLVPLITLVRSLMETNSIFLRINNLTKKAIDEDNIDNLDEEAMIVLCGTKEEDEEEYKSKNILGYLDKAAKEYEPFPLREIYDNLSEFVHPNHDGCLGSYGSIAGNFEHLHLGLHLEENDFVFKQAINFLLINLQLFKKEYETNKVLVKHLIPICESKLN